MLSKYIYFQLSYLYKLIMAVAVSDMFEQSLTDNVTVYIDQYL
jgi:hypothetical protein